MLLSEAFSASDSTRYLLFKAGHPLGDTTDYIRWCNNGHLTDDEQTARDAFAALKAHGRNLDHGEDVYQQMIDAGQGNTQEAANLRAQLDTAENLFTTCCNVAQEALTMAGGDLEINTNAGLEGWEDLGLVLTGLALVAVAVVAIVFFPEAVAAVALGGAMLSVIGATGAAIALLGSIGIFVDSGNTAAKLGGLGIIAAIGLGLLFYFGSKRRSG